jgi:hypothetical protein
MKYTGRNEVKNVFLFRFPFAWRQDDRVSGICSALVPGYNIRVFAQMIDNFSFSFIAPLGTDNNLNWHGSSLYVMYE